MPRHVYARRRGEAGRRRSPGTLAHGARASDQALGGFRKPPAQCRVRTRMLLTLRDSEQVFEGLFTLMPDAEKLLRFDFTVPAGFLVRRDGFS